LQREQTVKEQKRTTKEKLKSKLKQESKKYESMKEEKSNFRFTLKASKAKKAKIIMQKKEKNLNSTGIQGRGSKI
jgi:hypothetical protein